MKKYLALLILGFLLFSCKAKQSGVITSKNEAIKKNIYDTRLPKQVTALQTKTAPLLFERTAQEQKEVDKHNESLEVIEKKNTDKIVLEDNVQDVIIKVENCSSMGEDLVKLAKQNLGSPYHTGGTSPSGFDCSGLMYATYKKFDIFLPRTSTQMAQIGRILDLKDIRPGDLIFFRTNGKHHINHVGMVVSVNDEEITFIHSSTQRGVIISSTKEAYYNRTFAQVNRIIE